MPYSLADLPKPDAPLADWLAGKGIPFEFDGAAFFIRQPTTSEYDDAMLLYERAHGSYLMSEIGREDAGTPSVTALRIAETMDAQAETASFVDALKLRDDAKRMRELTLAEQLARQYAALARDRWLTARLLCGPDGQAMFDTRTPDGVRRFDLCPLRLKDAARPYIWQMLEVVQTLPFGWERWNGSASEPESDSANGPTET